VIRDGDTTVQGHGVFEPAYLSINSRKLEPEN